MDEAFFLNIIDALVNDGYIIIPDAFETTLASGLRETLHLKDNFKKAGISQNSHTDTLRRSDSISWLDEDDSHQSRYLHIMQELQRHLNKELYLGVNNYESHFAIYEKGDFYEKHLDAFRTSNTRLVTTTYYLNQDWNQTDGGELVIYDKNNEMIEQVLPQENTLVVFLSGKFPHEVKESQRRRLSIAGWFRNDPLL